MIRQLLLLLHLLAAVAWIGGMFFTYFCLRPAVGEVLEPPKRVQLMVATFSRFLPCALVAVVALLATGFTMMLATGMANAPVGWHIMMTLGLVMSAVFAYVFAALWPKLRAAAATSEWPVAAKALDSIRKLVALNLALGVCVVVAAVSAR